jgi:hypothetical protein
MTLYGAAISRALTSSGSNGARPLIHRLFGLGQEPRTFEFKCIECGAIHRGSPSFGFDKPSSYYDVPEPERDTRIMLTKDTCFIVPAADNEGGQIHYFLRGLLEVPIVGATEPFLWGVWVTQSEDSFMKYLETFDHDQSGTSSFGWLPVAWAAYKRTRPGEYLENLRCSVHWQKKGKRPLIEVQECDHPLYFDQRDGISWDRAIEIARTVMHGDRPQTR